jgi:hypothetical protein
MSSDRTWLTTAKSAIKRHEGIAARNSYKIDFTNLLSKVGISTASAQDLDVFAESIKLPERTLSSYDWAIWNHTIKIPTGYSESGIDITFALTNDYFVKNVMDAWLGLVVDTQTYNIAYDSDYKTDIKIYHQVISEPQPSPNAIRRENANTTKNIAGYHIKGAYPLSVSSYELSALDDTPVKISVSLTFDRYEMIDREQLKNI